VDFMAICYISWSFGTYFPILVRFTKTIWQTLVVDRRTNATNERKKLIKIMSERVTSRVTRARFLKTLSSGVALSSDKVGPFSL
jgi:hypothetical protein